LNDLKEGFLKKEKKEILRRDVRKTKKNSLHKKKQKIKKKDFF